MLNERKVENTDGIMEMIQRRILEKSAGETLETGSSGFRRDYSLFDFVFLDDEKFVKTVFRSFFKREPSQDEVLQYLLLIRNNRINKLELISLLLQSQEGKAHGIVLPDLDRPYSGSPYSVNNSGFFPDLAIEIKKDYDLFELIQFKDAEFLAAIYRIILNRDPDRSGVEYYLNSLQSGRLNRVEIIGRLRYSREGRKKQIRIRGLLFPFLSQRVRRVPFIGKFLSGFIGFLPLFNIPSRIARLERHLEKSVIELGIRDRSMEERMNLSTDRTLRMIADLSNHIADNRDIIRKMGRSDTSESTDLISPFLRELRNSIGTNSIPTAPAMDEIVNEITTPGTLGPDTPLAITGLGNGDWLRHFHKKDLPVFGLDQDRQQLEQCLESGLEVMNGDPILILKNRKPASLGGFALFYSGYFQDFGELFLLLHEAHRVLVPGAPLLIETRSNQEHTENESLESFLLDPERKQQLPVELIRFILDYNNFTSIREVRPGSTGESDRTFSALFGFRS